MNNAIKFEYIKRNWELRDGIVYSRRTAGPVVFAADDNHSRRYQTIRVNGKAYAVHIHEAIFVLHHNRPIAEGKEIHHVDGDYENNAIDNLVELTRTQHRRIHKYQINDPLRGIILKEGAWYFQWNDDNGKRTGRRFNNLNDAMTFRSEIERPRRQELRALGLNCKRVGSGEKPRRLYAAKSIFYVQQPSYRKLIIGDKNHVLY